MITQERLKETLIYNPDTGLFKWNLERPVSHFDTLHGYKVWESVYSKSSPGSLTNRGYFAIYILGKRYSLHRLAWLYMTGSMPVNEIDHINGNGRDNRFINLRSVDHKENGRNQKRPSNNTSGHVGVTWVPKRNRWLSYIRINDKHIHIGYFKYEDKDKAVSARERYESTHGFHENHGRP